MTDHVTEIYIMEESREIALVPGKKEVITIKDCGLQLYRSSQFAGNFFIQKPYFLFKQSLW